MLDEPVRNALVYSKSPWSRNEGLAVCHARKGGHVLFAGSSASLILPKYWRMRSYTKDQLYSNP